MERIHQRIETLAMLGRFLKQFASITPVKEEGIAHNEVWFDKFQEELRRAEIKNSWFTTEQLAFALEGWSELLTETRLKAWMSSYLLEDKEAKTIAIIAAGNIPMVGFHDLLSVLILGHKAVVKLSSSDPVLLPAMMEYLEMCDPSFKGKVNFTKDKLGNYDAVIATGSDNTARYFEYYFGAKPHIIRRNRNSAAVLTGNETEEELQALGEDIFRYYGLGCRSVSKLFIPEDYDFDPFFKAIYLFRDIIEEEKYSNNYDYNKAVYLMSLFKLTENGFLMLKEDSSYASPIATVFYEKYTDTETLGVKLEEDKDKIQCVVGNTPPLTTVAFGESQRPGLMDYADGVDVIRFLLGL